jgi:transposase-like protein
MYSFPFEKLDEEYEYHDNVCFECEERNEKLERAADFLDNIVKILYSNQPLETVDLEYNLDELCHLLNVDMGKGDLTIERKNKQTKYLSNWIEFNKQHLKREPRL